MGFWTRLFRKQQAVTELTAAPQSPLQYEQPPQEAVNKLTAGLAFAAKLGEQGARLDNIEKSLERMPLEAISERLARLEMKTESLLTHLAQAPAVNKLTADESPPLQNKQQLEAAVNKLMEISSPICYHNIDSEERIAEIYRQQGWNCIPGGWPDFFLIRRNDGKVEIKFVEVKAGSGKLRPDQRAVKEWLETQGWSYALEYDVTTLTPGEKKLLEVIQAGANKENVSELADRTGFGAASIRVMLSRMTKKGLLDV